MFLIYLNFGRLLVTDVFWRSGEIFSYKISTKNPQFKINSKIVDNKLNPPETKPVLVAAVPCRFIG